ncbi:uncharacterized protein BDW43DRAFT_273278 [Aspergillus alliaceus]|uniref:uncharacterized protein n=1 Tax=Petromyces alliaceus TaxID=209559 RepID=UPI0012A62FC1|nr:uncharacterized protein BDW43DRAFT_273278 [Aspergillus alliaceus]KAB8234481.1 hypothetical protein BDW43DRAFT_273278 [Aspergillus alliaceus]
MVQAFLPSSENLPSVITVPLFPVISDRSIQDHFTQNRKASLHRDLVDQKPPMTKYDRLQERGSSEYDDHHEFDQAAARLPTQRQKLLLRVKYALILLLAVFGFFDLAYRAYTSIPSRRTISCNCGETIEEAIANNCRYDSFAAAWLPPACRNDELIEKFEASGPNPDGSWTYYADKNKTQVLSLEEVSMLPKTGSHFFTTHHWHLVHCAYYWKKMFLAAEKGTVIEARYNNWAHIDHCEMMFLKRDPLDTIVTEAGVALHSDQMVVAKKHGHKGHEDHQMNKEGDY